ncbi:glycosyltransferase family 2 protein, partial [Tropicimonas sp. S265A]|uniref:glycosyltransferase family 2 protein n=1 Tax=Tropicimonas sp. S265A TaxID=3415134 RepID=UPI003C7B4614
MLRRVRRLFQRYCDHHLAFDAGGCALPGGGKTGSRQGFVDRVEGRGTCLRVVGWSLADHVTLRWDGGETSARPHLPRADVAQALGTTRETGFVLEAPLGADPLTLHIQVAGQERAVVLPSVVRAHRTARVRLAARFLGDVMRCAPAVLGYGMFRSAAYRARIKRALGLEDVPRAGPLETRLFTFDPQEVLTYPTDRRITIVMPVYNAFDVTQEALSRVARHTDTPWHLVLVEDGSSDPRVRPWLRDWAKMQNALQADCVTLIENEANLGFIGSVNRGFEVALARGDTVVLLNSDALVPDGWASRLIRPIFAHEDVASVTPMSNDAEIFSAPLICKRRALRAGEGDHLAALARKFHPEA